ncbi:energy-coupled thiamine transporter ThiT [Halanaerobacter jeridensis]|uniref:Thiamine transporter n=1 Tax=Halanaerobacter jeridensis TaxID=706427 RepID=A0A938XW03_9FIRM|nr:energy-coupled thiamine transporter ThiT [Halanaerobacter jeridensis]MBM7556637.1 thiamine transporter [Halanaerobacter jeridensis]
MNSQQIKKLAESGVSLALAVVLGFFTIYKMPQGGSVSLEMLPIIFIALRWSWKDGVMLGTAYGVMQIMFSNSIFHWAQVILDYPVAFALLGLAGIVGNLAQKDSLAEKSRIISLGVILAGSTRFIIHFLSGMIFFAEYAPEGQPVWLYSLVYNGSYMIPETIITLVVMVMLNKVLVSNYSLSQVGQEY